MRLNNCLQKTGATTLILSAILLILFSSVKDRGSDEYIWIETENADYVTAPLYIERDEDASGNKIIVCKGAHMSNSGIAQYKISVKKEGKYYFWLRCYWRDACSNLFMIQHDNVKYHCGDDPVYGKWHWVKCSSMNFKEGVNEVFLLSHDEGVRMDKILLTMNPEYVPADKLQEMYFLDFEDSLVNKSKIRNIDNWQIINDSISSVHVLVSPKENREIALLDKTDCKDDFIFQLTAKAVEAQSELHIIIDYINANNYRFISIGRTTVRYCHFNNNHDDLIFEKEGHFLDSEFKSIALAKTNEYLKLKMEGKTVFDLTTGVEMKGEAGIGVLTGNVFLDNIAYYSPVSLIQEDSFHDIVYYQFHKSRPEKTVNPFNNIRAGHNDWWALSGEWNRVKEGNEDIRGIAGKDIEKPAMLIFGSDFWTDYTFKVATKVKDDSGFGICTYFQDSLNYYLFRWFHDRDGYYKRQLVKMEDGNENILASDNEAFVIDTWYDTGMKILDGKLTVIVNNKPVLTTTDYTFKEGRSGFWTNSLQNAHFDDIKISASDSTWTVNNSRRYIFDTGSGLALARNLCDWTPDSQKNLYQYNQWGSCIYYLSKNVFEEVTLNNINTFYENFKIEVNANRIPQDIDAVFEFISQNEEAIVYKFIISKEKITLLKNEKMLASNTITSGREKIVIYRRDNEWTIELAAKKAFEYKDKIEPGCWNMAVGYSGPGKGQIFLNYIIIDAHL